MEKYIIVSTNNNPDYFIYAPYLEKAWNQYGWNLCIMHTEDVTPELLRLRNRSSIIITLPRIAVRSETLAQAGRLYAANHLPGDSMIMTSDMDLLPLTDYWHPHSEKITVYGHDLTGYTSYPMGYIAMSGNNWKEKMHLTGSTKDDMLRDIISFPDSRSEKWEQWWNYDQSLITAKIPKNEIMFINRGRRLSGTYAYGRIDRGDGCQIPIGETLIDAHLENNNSSHPDKFNKFLTLFNSIYGPI